MIYKILIICLFVFINTSRSQINDQSQPESILKEAIISIQDQDYLGYTKLLHPDAALPLIKLINILRSAGLDDARVLGLFGVNTFDELNSAPDSVLVSNFIQYIFIASQEDKSLNISEPIIIGKINEGIDTVHVVYRYSLTTDNMTITKVQVESLKRSELGWRLLLKGDLESVIELLLKRYEKL